MQLPCTLIFQGATTVMTWQRLYKERGAAVFKRKTLEQLSPIFQSNDIERILKTPLVEANPRSHCTA